MSDQTSHVSGGLSLLLKMIKPERPESTIGRDGNTKSVSAFSNDLDQARQQHLDKIRALPAQPENSKAGKLVTVANAKNSTPSATMVTSSRTDAGGVTQDPRNKEQAAASVAERLMSIDTDELTNGLQIGTIQRPNEDAKQKTVLAIDSQGKLPVTALSPVKASKVKTSNPQVMRMQQQLHAALIPLVSETASEVTAPVTSNGVRGGAMGEAVMQVALAGSSRQFARATAEGGLPQNSLNEEQTEASVAGRHVPTEIDELVNALPTDNIQRPNDDANQNAIVAIDSQNKLPVTVRLSENGNGIKASNPAAMQLLQQQSAESPPVVRDAALTPVVKNAASNMTSPAPIVRSLNGTIGQLITQGTLAGRSGQVADNLEKTTSMTHVPGLATGNLRQPGAGSNTGKTVPEPLTSEPAAISKLELVNAMGLAQAHSGNARVTQTTLASRLHPQRTDAAEKGAAMLLKTGDSGLLHPEAARLNARGHERLPVGDSPLLNNSVSGVDSMIGVTDVNKVVLQRIATTEAMQAQLAVDAGNAVVRAPVADNMFLAMSGGNVAAPAVQHTVSVAGPIIQAPFDIPLESADAETALTGNVKWMTNEGVKNAVMTVSPHGMGPISIKIGIDGNQMDVSIIASQHTTRDALESMLPRLREFLAVQGHESVKVEVSDGKSDQSRSGNGHAFSDSRNPAGATPQDNQSNSSHHGEKSANGDSEQVEVVSESVMAEDLQRVAARVVGEVDGRPVFDAYV